MAYEIMQEIGLSEAEAKVYLALLGLGSSSAGPIIKKTGLHKGTTYAVLERLVEKGFASYILEGNNRFFSAANPEVFLENLKQKEEKFREILPELKQKIGSLKARHEATIYMGTKGVRSACESMLEELNPKGEYVDFGVSGLFKEIAGPYFSVWQGKKEKYGIKSRCIFDESVKKNKELLRQYVGKARFTPTKYYSSIDTFVYKDKIMLGVWKAEPPIAIVIKSREAADAYRNLFEMLWKLSERKDVLKE